MTSDEKREAEARAIALQPDQQPRCFAGVWFATADDWPKMPEPEEVAQWEAEWSATLAAEARSRAA